MVRQKRAEILAEFSALLGSINDEIRKRDQEYALKLLSCLDAENKANRAKIKAETSEEYQRKQEARDTKEVCKEMIGSLKYYLRSKEEEYKLTR